MGAGAERAIRVDLAACYRLVAHFGMADGILNHISARVPGPQEGFLLNPLGLLYEEVTASNLVKVTIDGEVLHDETGMGVNPAGYLIHSAIHRARPDVDCVIHTHTTAGIAVAIQAEGLLPISQQAAMLQGMIAYHDYEGIVLDPAEQARLRADLGAAKALILNNHGLLTAGRDIAEAFSLMLTLERACQIQVAALVGGRPIRAIDPAVLDKSQALDIWAPGRWNRAWAAMLRLADRVSPGFRD